MQLTSKTLGAGLVALGTALGACGGDKSAAPPPAEAGGSGGTTLCPPAGAGGAAGAGGGVVLGVSTCEAGKYIFLTTLDNDLLRFDPKTLAIEPVTKLTCKAALNAVPVAFAVDKQSVAWINYSDGSLHRLDMAKLACEKTAYEPYQQGWQKFAMTFNKDPSDPSGESLLVADLTLNNASEDNPVNGLGRISTGDLKLSLIGDFDGQFTKQRPLITGRGDGRLFAIFIDSDLPRRTITEIDPASAKILSSTLVPAPRALYGSFAHWGGSYYYFYSSDEFTPSSIARYTPGKGMKVIVKDAGRILYGSSVSTCAPTSNPDIK